MSTEIILGIIGLALNFLGLLGAGLMAFNKLTTNQARDIRLLQDMWDTKREQDLRIIEEGFRALRDKIGHVELYSERTFARRNSVHEAVKRVTDIISEIKQELKGEFEKLEDKFDKMERRD